MHPEIVADLAVLATRSARIRREDDQKEQEEQAKDAALGAMIAKANAADKKKLKIHNTVEGGNVKGDTQANPVIIDD